MILAEKISEESGDNYEKEKQFIDNHVDTACMRGYANRLYRQP